MGLDLMDRAILPPPFISLHMNAAAAMAAQDLPAGRILPEGAGMAGRETLAHGGPQRVPDPAWAPIGGIADHVAEILIGSA